MARAAHSDLALKVEHHDPPEVLAEKVERLVSLLHWNRHFKRPSVAFTGAGVSTSAGIGDFRGPNGKWTCEAEGRAVPKGVSSIKAFPTVTHMSVVQLYQNDFITHVISQNCDGLHRRSGLPAVAISELHGNSNVEICETCGQDYFRDFKCERMTRSAYDHFTGRFCQCGGRLLNSSIDFGQRLHTEALGVATDHSMRAHLHLVLGSSLTVSPACNLPGHTANNGGHLVICNLQKTPLTCLADFQIYAETDTVMALVLQQLNITLQLFRLPRRMIVGLSDDDSTIYIDAVDMYDPTQRMGVLRAVDWDGFGVSRAALDQPASIIAERNTAFTRPVNGLDLTSVKPTLHFVGHYKEPPFQLNLNVLRDRVVDVMLSFDPYSGVWSCKSVDSFDPYAGICSSPRSRSNRFGLDHREYCIQSWKLRHGKSRLAAAAIVDKQADESKATAIAISLALGGTGGASGAAESDDVFARVLQDVQPTHGSSFCGGCRCGFTGSSPESMSAHLERFLGDPRHGETILSQSTQSIREKLWESHLLHNAIAGKLVQIEPFF